MQLVDAVKARDVAQARAILAREPSQARSRTPEGMGVLQLALYYRVQQVIDEILAAGAEPNVWEAAIMGDVARLRAADRALLSSPGADGFTPLHLAAHF